MLVLLLACRDRPPADPSAAALYDDARVLEVELHGIDDRDWADLRTETRSLWDVYSGDCLAQPFESPFDWYTGDATLDGVELGAVGVRKKGFLGSLDSERPSLKLDLGRVTSATTYDGFAQLTLNNGRQDPTGLRTCLAYRTFRDAGVPAPRCTLAHVTVNGEDLGLYSNVEPVDEGFLARHGLAADGGLFEGTLSDLRDGWVGTFNPETDDSDVEDLGPVVAAVETADLDAIGRRVDLDPYLRFWAAEVLVGQWDGYDANTNNFFLYEDPATGRVQFFPWGPDTAFDREAPFDPAWVAANSALARAVLLAPGGEDRYRQELEALLDQVWDGDAMADEARRLAELAEPWEGPAYPTDLAALLEVVEGRDGVLRAALAADPTGSTGALRDPPCFVDRGSITTTFATTWDTLGADPWSTGASTVQLTWDGEEVPVTPVGAVAGAQGDEVVVAGYADLSDGGYPCPTHTSAPTTSARHASVRLHPGGRGADVLGRRRGSGFRGLPRGGRRPVGRGLGRGGRSGRGPTRGPPVLLRLVAVQRRHEPDPAFPPELLVQTVGERPDLGAGPARRQQLRGPHQQRHLQADPQRHPP